MVKNFSYQQLKAGDILSSDTGIYDPEIKYLILEKRGKNLLKIFILEGPDPCFPHSLIRTWSFRIIKNDILVVY